MSSRTWLMTAVVVATVTLMTPMQESVSAQSGGIVVISQVFGGGGNTGAPFTHDFVELFNRGTAPVVLNGKSLQYASATGVGHFSASGVVQLTGTLQPGQYFLVRQAAGAGNGVALPAFNASGTVQMSATAGKVALVNGTGGLNCNGGGTPCSATQLSMILDLVGYGNANFFEGAAAPAMSDATAALRAAGGCTDTNVNASDFSVAAPTPRNLATPAAPCDGSPRLTVANVTGEATQFTPLVVVANVTPGTNPPSTALSVQADLLALGGLASQAFADDGVAPDVAANDNLFTTSFLVNQALGAGSYPFSVVVTDGESRSGTANASLILTPGPVISLPHDIQSAGSLSPFEGAPVAVRGVVTARTVDGFFIQTVPGLEDADPASSEGLFALVSGGGPAAAQVGRQVQVHGTVAEFRTGGELTSPSRTELNGITAVWELGDAPLPEPYVLTADDLSPAGTLDQLEHLEGMRVTAASLTAISGTGGVRTEANASSQSNGAFFAVLTGEARPFREPGIEAGRAPLACAAETCNILEFDGNPERLRVDTDAVEGLVPVDVATGAVVTGVTGPLDFSDRAYTILAETALVPTGGLLPATAPAPANGQYSIASLNLDRFYDSVDDAGEAVVLTTEALDTRLAKASLTIRGVLRTPDVLGLQGVEHASVLQQLATRVDEDAVLAGQPAPGYAPILFEGNAPDGLDVAFLVKGNGGRVTLLASEQLDAAATFENPSLENELLNDRPPVLVRLSIQAPGFFPRDVTVIVNHLLSLTDVDLDNGAGELVRAKRRAQAEFLATLIQNRLSNDPSEAIASIGDYNAFGFNDGYVDTIGTVLGTPAAEDAVVLASTDVWPVDLVNVGELAPDAERYSSVSSGNAQALDHVIVSPGLFAEFGGLARPRVNADFPEAERGDDTTAVRLGDQDPVVAFFNLTPDQVAPELAATPADVLAPATGPSGAVVTFATPAATDNLDEVVPVACVPASGSTFPVGPTTVTCTATDAAGNTAAVSFQVTIVDDGAPVVHVPANITVTAPTSAGTSVTFVATATDAVDLNPQVTCTPASGSTFAPGVTPVNCTATDASGNSSASAGFTVTVDVAPPTPQNTAGHMAGLGEVGHSRQRAWFLFDVRESIHQVERGWVVLQVKDGYGRPDRYLSASVKDVQFSNAAGYSPGWGSPSGVDTVTFSGVGYWNGRSGHKFIITATDRGEPGRGRDTFALVIKAPNGTIVESVSGTLRDGNVQSQR